MSSLGIVVENDFIIPKMINNYFYNYIHKNNETIALVCLYKFYVLENIEIANSNDIKEKIILKLNQKVSNTLKKNNIIFFKTSNNEHGFALFDKQLKYINIKESCQNNNLRFRPDNDILKSIETNILSSLPNKIKINNTILNIQLSVSACLYGVHDNCLNKLININSLQLDNYDYDQNKNVIIFYDHKLNISSFNSNEALKKLKNHVCLDDFNIEIDPIKFNNKSNKQIYIYPKYYCLKLLSQDINIFKKEYGTEINNLLLRFLAIKLIHLYIESKYFKKYPLLLPYPIDELNNDNLSFGKIIRKLNFFNLTVSDVVFVFNMNDIIYRYDKIIDNLLAAQKLGINYLLTDLKAINILQYIKPNGITINRTINSNKDIYNKVVSICQMFNITILQ